MPRGRPRSELKLSDAQRHQLESIIRSRSLPHAIVSRAQMVLASADGKTDLAIARRLKLNRMTVARWRNRYAEHGIEGLHDELRAGRPRSYDDERVADVINQALQTRPPNGTHWSVRSMAEQTGISKSTVQRWFDLFGIQPHRHRQKVHPFQ